MTTTDETERVQETMEKAIRRACKEAGVPDKAEEFLRDGRSWVYVRDWLMRNTPWRPKPAGLDGEDAEDEGLADAPKSFADLDAKAIYKRFNNPPKKSADS